MTSKLEVGRKVYHLIAKEQGSHAAMVEGEALQLGSLGCETTNPLRCSLNISPSLNLLRTAFQLRLDVIARSSRRINRTNAWVGHVVESIETIFYCLPNAGFEGFR